MKSILCANEYKVEVYYKSLWSSIFINLQREIVWIHYLFDNKLIFFYNNNYWVVKMGKKE